MFYLIVSTDITQLPNITILEHVKYSQNILKVKNKHLPLERTTEQIININIKNLITSGMDTLTANLSFLAFSLSRCPTQRPHSGKCLIR